MRIFDTPIAEERWLDGQVATPDSNPSTVPANALLDDNNQPLTDDNGEILTT